MTPKYKKHVWFAEVQVAVPRSVNRSRKTMRMEIEARSLQEEIQVIIDRLLWLLRKRPYCESNADNTFYVQVKPEDAREIVEENLVKGRKVGACSMLIPKQKNR
jgi:(2Fe-2S) ferredoxin